MSSKAVLLNLPAPTADLASLSGEWRVVAEARDRVPLPWLCLFSAAALQPCTLSWLEAAEIEGRPRQLLRRLAIRNAVVSVQDAKRHLAAARPLFERVVRDRQVGARRWKEALDALDGLPLDWLAIDPGAVLLRPAFGDGPALFAAALSSGLDGGAEATACAEARRRLARLDADASDDENFEGMDAGSLDPDRFPRRTRTPAEAQAFQALLARLDTCHLAQTPSGYETLPLDLDGLTPPPAFWRDAAALERGRRHATAACGPSSFMGTVRLQSVRLDNVSGQRLRVRQYATFERTADSYRLVHPKGEWSGAKEFIARFGVPEDGWIPAGGSVSDGAHGGGDIEGLVAFWCEDEAQERFMVVAPRPPSRTGGRLRRVDGRPEPDAKDPWSPCPPSVGRAIEEHAAMCRRYARDRFQREVDFDLEGVRWLDDAVEAHHRQVATIDRGGNAKYFGAFLGECLVRVFGGRWARLDEVLCVRLGETTCFPFLQVDRQLVGGRASGESVLAFFQRFGAMQRKQASSLQQRFAALAKARRDFRFVIAHGPAQALQWSPVKRVDGAGVHVDAPLRGGRGTPDGPGAAADEVVPLDAVVDFQAFDADGRPVDPDFAVVAPTQVLAQPPKPEAEVLLMKLRAGLVQRRAGWDEAALAAVMAPKPAKLQAGGPLSDAVDQQRLLLTEGTVVWGAVVQANMGLFMDGPEDLPAQLIFSRDPYFDARPNELLAIAQRLYALKNTTPTDPRERAVAALVTDERNRRMGWPLPPEITARPVLVTIVMMHRQHLRRRVAPAGACCPVLTHPSTAALLVVPWQFWPEGM